MIWRIILDFIELIFPVSLLCCISMCILFKESMQIKKLTGLFFMAFFSGIILETGSYLLPLPVLTIITVYGIRDNKDKIKDFINIFCIYLLMYVEYISTLIFSKTDYFDHTYMPFKLQIFLMCILYAFVILSCVIIKNVFLCKQQSKKLNSSQIRSRMILVISLPLSILIFFMAPVMSVAYRNQGLKYVVSIINIGISEVLPLIIVLLINIIVYNYDKSVENKVKLKREVEEKREIEEYSKIIENMYSETRKFKHDYMNMLTPLKEYIDSENISELKKFFYDNILDMDKSVKWNNSNIDKLKYVKVLGVKAILSAKIISAMSKKIDIKLELMEDIDNIAMNVMDLCRITGVLMDNAIEASEQCEKPKIFLCIVNKKDYVVMVIENNYFGDKPVIHKIYKEGFSTKGRNRGLGLSNVKHIVDSYENAFINTSVEDNMFTQELWIKNNFS